MRECETYNLVVNIVDREIEMLNDIFGYDDGFKGATGSRLRAVSRDEYNEALSEESVKERLLDCGVINKDTSLKMMDIVAQAYYDEMKSNGELEDFMFDTSYIEHWEYLRTFGFPEEDFPIFECTGGGRMFDKDCVFNQNTYLQELVRKAETDDGKL